MSGRATMRMSTEQPELSFAFTSAPAAIRALTAATQTLSAYMSAVWPSVVLAFTYAPAAIRALTRSVLPVLAASISAVRPSLFFAFTSSLPDDPGGVGISMVVSVEVGLLQHFTLVRTGAYARGALRIPRTGQ